MAALAERRIRLLPHSTQIRLSLSQMVLGTIFPFWVPGPEGAGYVELPYTLVQDLNLFMVLQEQNRHLEAEGRLDCRKRRHGVAEHSP